MSVPDPGVTGRAFVALQHLLPQHGISRLVLAATRSRSPGFKNALIRLFMRGFRPDMTDAVITEPTAYASFNEFFTRALRPDARPVDTDARAIVSPVDGTVSEAGPLTDDQVLQAKGHLYSLRALLAGNDAWQRTFAGGSFATIYLAPYNYHRIHMALPGELRESFYVPGRLFSVNRTTAQLVPGLFARNERVFCGFDAGGMPWGIILVGALNVGSMATVWHGEVTPRRLRDKTALPVTDVLAPLALDKGDEMARFNMGSTVILLLPRGASQWNGKMVAGQTLRMGERIGTLEPRGVNTSGESGGSWKPTASQTALRRRATALRHAREFFHARDVLEVETPAMVNAPVSDVNLGSVRVHVPGKDTPLFLHTSPEYAMKRLLAAGSGDIYQICRVYRGAERGRQHNPEFTMLEWYRLGFSLADLMNEVAELVRGLLGGAALPVETLSYREAVALHAGFDPIEAPDGELRRAAQKLGFEAAHARAAARDELLDLIVGAQVGPALGANSLTFVQGYPASQAALARLDAGDPRVALRFELYYKGIELANGYHELSSVVEQRQRFAADQQIRLARGLPVNTLDPHLLAALAAGLPDCAGVALGFDRVLMLALGAGSIDEVLAFPVERA